MTSPKNFCIAECAHIHTQNTTRSLLALAYVGTTYVIHMAVLCCAVYPMRATDVKYMALKHRTENHRARTYYYLCNVHSTQHTLPDTHRQSIDFFYWFRFRTKDMCTMFSAFTRVQGFRGQVLGAGIV